MLSAAVIAGADEGGAMSVISGSSQNLEQDRQCNSIWQSTNGPFHHEAPRQDSEF